MGKRLNLLPMVLPAASRKSASPSPSIAPVRTSDLAIAGLLALGLLALASSPGRAQDAAAFSAWVEQLWPEARARGVSEALFRRAFRDVSPDPEIIRLSEHQPEFVRPVWDYLGSAVSDARIRNGQAMLAQHKAIFDAIEEKYGVSRHYVAAIWGIETSYGSFMGNKSVIRSLATLAYTGERQAFGREQLLAALDILQKGDIEPENMKGSWAGAMGHTQFIPTTYQQLAVDFTGDGKRDIWRSIPDALASTANFFRDKGWRSGETWGYEAVLPNGFDYGLADDRTQKTLAEWARLGITRPNGRPFPRPDDLATLILPAGARGPAFLTIANFNVIKRYNNSTSYALAVGHLADRLLGVGPFVQSWPRDVTPLARSEREELQKLLAGMGFLDGNIDGIIGPQTRAAVRTFQRSRQMTPDGFPTKELLELVRGANSG
jgi:membrane-bound lytic murein transglycosylase B